MSEPREAVYLAASSRDAERVEEILESEGIEYDIGLDVPDDASGVCFQRLLIQVDAAAAAGCRELLTSRGFARGIVGAK